MTTVRQAVEADIDRLVEMACRFASESEYSKVAAVDAEKVTGLIGRLIATEGSVVFIGEVDGETVAMIGGHLFDHPMLDAVFAAEVAWWVEPEHRSSRVGYKLLQSFTAWSVEHDATHISMVAPNEHVGQFYRRLGFMEVEREYLRRL